ncbi:MAG: sodium:proton antiporter [Planctomycetota bacterium]|nr:sodium:proton antiporter [Planctomycetota bacterium]
MAERKKDEAEVVVPPATHADEPRTGLVSAAEGGHEDHVHPGGFSGPLCWLVTGIAGALIGLLVAGVVPATIVEGSKGPQIPLWLVGPFVALLASIALMPFIAPRFWHAHYPDFATFLGGFVAAYYLRAFGGIPYEHDMAYGASKMLHAFIEYYGFIALVGGLFVVAGGVHIEARIEGKPLANTAILAFGAVLSNLVGTTGASMLLIRPFMRINHGRLTPMHIVFFIFIVSNCGGALTPIGDPPLYLGYLKGVTFFWTLEHLWPDWLLVVGLLLGVYFVYDSRIKATSTLTAPRASSGSPIRIRGFSALVCLGLMILGVFIDPILKETTGIKGIPIGATFQLLVAVAAFLLASRHIHRENHFNFGPIKEVGLLFLGIFATMVPALGYLAANAAKFNLGSPTTLYFATGALSAVLDNAPTYLNFLQVAMASAGFGELDPPSVRAFIATELGALELHAISTSAVFFGAMTYIGNGPNFMVKSIAEGHGVKMPSFFGYIGRALAVLLPILVLNWLLIIGLR